MLRIFHFYMQFLFMGQAGADVLFPDHILIFDWKKIKKMTAPIDVIKANNDAIILFLYNLIRLLFNNKNIFGICNDTHHNVF